MDGRLAVSRQEEEDKRSILEPAGPWPPPEEKKITGMGIALRGFLDLQSQAVHVAPHVGSPDREPYMYA